MASTLIDEGSSSSLSPPDLSSPPPTPPSLHGAPIGKVNPGDSTTANGPKRPRKKKDDAQPGDKPKKPRAPRGQGPRALKKKAAAEQEAQRLAQQQQQQQQQQGVPEGKSQYFSTHQLHQPPTTQYTSAYGPVQSEPAPPSTMSGPPPLPQINHPPAQPSQPQSQIYTTHSMGRTGSTDTQYNHSRSSSTSTTMPAQPRAGSGQRYDPIRGTAVQQPTIYEGSSSARATTPVNTLTTPPRKTLAPAPSANRSPSIMSLIDPVDAPSIYAPSKRDMDATSPPDAKRVRLTPPPPPPPPPALSATSATTSSHLGPSPLARTTSAASASSAPTHGLDGSAESKLSNVSNTDTAMDVDQPAAAAPKPNTSGFVPVSTKPNPEAAAAAAAKAAASASKGPSSGTSSPKQAGASTRAAKDLVPLPSAGSGLLSGSVFGNGGSGTNGLIEGLTGSSKTSAPTVVLTIQLTGENQMINFTRLAEEKYGFNALHPRIAAQRDRLARVAAAGAALENAQKNGAGGDDDSMSVDLLSNDEGEGSNADGGKTGDTPAATEATAQKEEAPKKKKRVMKEDMYDIDDEFIDDAEQAWEEQAAVSKDGFFIHMGPLVPEGEEAKIERSGSQPPTTSSRRARGAGGSSRRDRDKDKDGANGDSKQAGANGSTSRSSRTGNASSDHPPRRSGEVKDYPGKPGPKKGWKEALRQKALAQGQPADTFLKKRPATSKESTNGDGGADKTNGGGDTAAAAATTPKANKTSPVAAVDTASSAPAPLAPLPLPQLSTNGTKPEAHANGHANEATDTTTNGLGSAPTPLAAPFATKQNE